MPMISRILVDIYKASNERDIFATQRLPQFISLLSKLPSFHGIFFFVDLIIDFDNFAIGLTFAFVAADDFGKVLCLRLQHVRARLVSLRVHRRGGDC